MEGDRSAEGDTTPFEPGRLVAQVPAEFVQKTRLADAGLPGDEDDLALPGFRADEAVGKLTELALATDVGGQAAVRLHFEPRAIATRCDDLPGRHWLALAFEGQFAKRARVEVGSGQPVR